MGGLLGAWVSQRASIDVYHAATINNNIIPFANGGEGHALNNKCSISCYFLCLGGVAIHAAAKTQSFIPCNSMMSELNTVFVLIKATKHAKAIHQHLRPWTPLQ